MIRYALVILFLLNCMSCSNGSDAPPAHRDEPGTGKVSSMGSESIRLNKTGTPDTLTFTFQRFIMAPATGRRTAEFTVFNGFSTNITAVQMLLFYRNPARQTIGSFHWSISETPVWLETGKNRTIVVGSNIPEEATMVDVLVREITFQDGDSLLVENEQ